MMSSQQDQREFQAKKQDEQDKSHPVGYSLDTLGLREEIAAGKMLHHTTVSFGNGYRMEVRQGLNSLWLFLKRNGKGGVALRTVYSPGPALQVEILPEKDDTCTFQVESALGTFMVKVHLPDCSQPLLRCTMQLTPKEDLILPFWPRDLYPIDANGNPVATTGVIDAAQRGLNSGLVFAQLIEPAFGTFLYFQNFTSLNDYFIATDTKPDGVVGGIWPELGYLPPVCQDKALPAGQTVVFSDVLLCFASELPDNERGKALLFLDMLAQVYRQLDKPPTEFFNWPQRAEESLRDLQHSPKATVKEHGYTYVHPYTDSEYPDSMVQLTTLVSLREFGRWKNEVIPFADALRKGVRHFFDIELGTIRRYLPSVGEDKDEDQVDSWYLYHPLANLGRLAKEGDDEARELLLDALPYAIKVAHHFDYTWPVLFNISTLEVIQATRKPGDPGQSDVGGLYANVLLMAYDITGESLYLEEAKKGIKTTQDLQFELTYQTNLVAWGTRACIVLWKLTGERFYLEQSYVFLASYFHNSLFWQSRIDNARHYLHFLGTTCLHDGPYMAAYECFESMVAFNEYLELGGEEIPESVRLLLTEFIKYGLNRLWYFYPDNLPVEALATEIRNGHIDRLLAFPLEDLYADGQPAGQVGQEIYGSGATFSLSARAFHRLDNATFLLYCEYPLFDISPINYEGVSFRVSGVRGATCKARLIPQDLGVTSPVVMEVASGQIRGQLTPEGHCEFNIPAGETVKVYWGGKG